MKLTTRARYGTRALLDIALSAEQPVQLKSVAERQGISKKYLEQLLAPLRDAGMVTTVRGPSGGYQLSRPLDQLRLGDVLRILEGPLELADCVADASICERAPRCAARQLWVALARALEEALHKMTVADLLDIHQHLSEDATAAQPAEEAVVPPPRPRCSTRRGGRLHGCMHGPVA